MDVGFVKAESTNLLRIDTLIVGKFFTLNPDFCSAELRNVKTSICSSAACIELTKIARIFIRSADYVQFRPGNIIRANKIRVVKNRGADRAKLLSSDLH